MNNANLINQTSGITEYYTPKNLTAAAGFLLGTIDYDPASSERANGLVGAKRFSAAPEFKDTYEQADFLPTRYYFGNGGLDVEWKGRVWMNHPFGSKENRCKADCTKKVCKKRGYHLGTNKPGNEAWINKMVSSYEDGQVTEAVMICFASTSEAWFRPLLSYPVCWLNGRVNYLDPVTLEPIKGATKGSVIFYLGENVEAFKDIFSRFGAVHRPA